ncbi:MAG: ribonuclease P protein component 4 [Halobacteriota archaeon]|nr:ribonuclease P protein component 4 [Halobacteriota archaeon]
MKRRERVRDITLQRITRLFELAELEFDDHPERSDRYVELARRMGMRNRVRIPKHLKIRMCKHCYSFLVPGKNARVRLRGNYVVTTCLNCNKPMRRPY